MLTQTFPGQHTNSPVTTPCYHASQLAGCELHHMAANPAFLQPVPHNIHTGGHAEEAY